VRDEFDKCPGFAWATYGRTIESYVQPDILGAAVGAVHPGRTLAWAGPRFGDPLEVATGPRATGPIDKVSVSRRVAAEWGGATNWRFDLAERVQTLARFIREANGRDQPRPA
jgi:hypothetical protein